MKRLCLILLLSLAARSGKAAFEDLGAGARGPGLGNAFTAIADDVYAIHYNPAGLGLLERPQIGFSYTRLHWGLTDDSNLNTSFMGYAHPLREGRYGTVATSWNSLSLNNSLYREDALTLAYGRLWLHGEGVGEGLYAGLAARYLRAGFGSFAEADNAIQGGGLAKTGLADPALAKRSGGGAIDADVGFLYRFGKQYTAGLALQHLTQPDISINGSGDRLPIAVKAGFGYRSLISNIIAEYANQKAPSGTRDHVVTAGAERWFPKQLLGDVGMRMALGLGSRDYKKLSLGLSYRTQRMQVDYGFSLPIGTVDAMTHRLAMGFRFGRATDAEETLEVVLEAMRQMKQASKPTLLEAEGSGLSRKQRITVEEYLAQVRALQAQANYQEALDIFSRALMVAPADKTLLAAYSRLNFVGRQIKSLPDYRSNPAQAALHEGILAYLAGRDVEAMQSMSRAVALHPDYRQLAFLSELGEVTGFKRVTLPLPAPEYRIAALVTQAISAITDRRYAEAVELTRQIVSLDPANALAWENMGTAYFALGDYESSLSAWRKALEYEQSPSVRDTIKGHIESVLRAKEGKALPPQVNPLPAKMLSSQQIRKLYNKGLDYYTRRQFDRARKCFKTILLADPENVEALQALRRVQEEFK